MSGRLREHGGSKLRQTANSAIHAFTRSVSLWAILAFIVCAASQSAHAGKLTVTLSTSTGSVVVGAAVTVHAAQGNSRAAPIAAIMDQIDRTFVPEVLVVPIGSSVSFPNSDTVNHQVYSFSPAKRFKLPLYRGKRYPPIKFEQVGIVTLGCNIHDYMQGFIVVTDAAYYGSTDQDGVWRSPAMPSGDYEVRIWHPRMREAANAIRRSVHIDANSRDDVRIEFSDALLPAPLQSKERKADY
jgi:plastocyanin